MVCQLYFLTFLLNILFRFMNHLWTPVIRNPMAKVVCLSRWRIMSAIRQKLRRFFLYKNEGEIYKRIQKLTPKSILSVSKAGVVVCGQEEEIAGDRKKVRKQKKDGKSVFPIVFPSWLWYSARPRLHVLLVPIWCQLYQKIMELSKSLCFPIVFPKRKISNLNFF